VELINGTPIIDVINRQTAVMRHGSRTGGRTAVQVDGIYEGAVIYGNDARRTTLSYTYTTFSDVQ